jgi:hypothetical protein
MFPGFIVGEAGQLLQVRFITAAFDKAYAKCPSQISAAYDQPPCRRLTSNIHSLQDLNRPEAKRFRVKLAFVRSLVIEDLSKTVELPLLEPQRQSCRPSCLLLEGSMHSFMTSVLLRTPRLNALVNDLHLHPSERELRQAE